MKAQELHTTNTWSLELWFIFRTMLLQGLANPHFLISNAVLLIVWLSCVRKHKSIARAF